MLTKGKCYKLIFFFDIFDVTASIVYVHSIIVYFEMEHRYVFLNTKSVTCQLLYEICCKWCYCKRKLVCLKQQKETGYCKMELTVKCVVFLDLFILITRTSFQLILYSFADIFAYNIEGAVKI